MDWWQSYVCIQYAVSKGIIQSEMSKKDVLELLNAFFSTKFPFNTHIEECLEAWNKVTFERLER